MGQSSFWVIAFAYHVLLTYKWANLVILFEGLTFILFQQFHGLPVAPNFVEIQHHRLG